MRPYLLSRRIALAVVQCRYVIYLYLAALVCLDGALLSGRAWVPALLLAQPLFWHGFAWAWPALYGRWAYYLQLPEWLVLSLLLMAGAVSSVVYAAASFIYLAGNIALWGWSRGLVPGLLSALPATFAGYANLSATQEGPITIGALAGAAFFALLICGVANQQSRLLGERGSWHRHRQHTLQRYLPGTVAHHLSEVGEGRVQRRWMAVVFVDLGGFAEACQTFALEEMRVVINEFLAEISALVEAWDGQVVKFLGDGMLCVFPAIDPGTNADAAIRAVRCFANLPERMRQLNGRWAHDGYHRCHTATCGIACGVCAVGDWGGDARKDFTVVGTPVNLAARLQSHAADYGGMLLDQRSAELAARGGIELQVHQLHLKSFGQRRAWSLRDPNAD